KNGKSPTNVPNSSNGMADDGEQLVPHENVSNSQRSFASLVTNKADTKFALVEGMNGVLKNGPWFIRYVPIILKKWTPTANLLKEDPNSFPIWVKLHDISIVAFTTNGLSAMATKLDPDKPINSKAEVKIPKAYALEVDSRFGFSLYGLFFFKFALVEGMNGVLKNGPWFIRYVPIILKKWTPTANLLKEDPNSFPIWVKLHDISIVAFTTNGLSAMATKL
nr:hypothetical protein [Tanacetum cinerariifolium]